MVVPEVSIIIPAHNEEKYIPSTLQSIYSQNFPNYEVIVVANGCNDQTVAAAKNVAQEGTVVYTLPRAHVSRSRNYGADKASADLLLFLDADTTLEPGALSTMVQEFTPAHSVATCRVKPDTTKIHHRAVMGLKNTMHRSGAYKGCSGSILCRKKDFDEVGGYDPALHVREHRKLIQKLLTKGKYLCSKAQTVTSMRRLEQWGLSKVASFWIGKWVKDKTKGLEKEEYEKVR
ncbi:glycosyltransferase [Candidatus Woesearchaeota archaeon]|nr:glycosyltransferase [Candidatus Woesearchaeota archaeon]